MPSNPKPTSEEFVEAVRGAGTDLAEPMDDTEKSAVDEQESTPETDEKESKGSHSSEGKKLTMEEREAKLAQIRKKFVRFSVYLVVRMKIRRDLLIKVFFP